MTAFTEVVDVCVTDARSADDRVLTVEVNEVVLNFEVCNAILTCVKVAEVTDVSYFFNGATMCVAVRVEVGSSCLAAFSEIA